MIRAVYLCLSIQHSPRRFITLLIALHPLAYLETNLLINYTISHYCVLLSALPTMFLEAYTPVSNRLFNGIIVSFILRASVFLYKIQFL